MILSPRELRTLEVLRPVPRKSFPGQIHGERLTRRKGVSIEFADYRDYAMGDDLRHLDWNVLARLESPVMKTYREEEDLAVHLLLDCSRSMQFGDPTKFGAATRAAGAIGFCALCAQDTVTASALGYKARKPAVWRSRPSFNKFRVWLENQNPEGTVPLGQSLRDFSMAAGRTGIVCIFSDGLDPDADKAVRALSSRGFEVWFIQVLSPIELDPDLEGDLKLIDVESKAEVEITANGDVLDAYRRSLDAHREGIAETCRRGGGRYALHTADEPLEELIKRVFRRQGWLAA